MTWLTLHILLELLLAALFGALIGWALRGRRMAAGAQAPDAAVSVEADLKSRARVRELENQLAAQRNEIATLRQTGSARAVIAAPAPGPAPVQPVMQVVTTDTGSENSLSWRNRYLESRVRFLEGKIAEQDDHRAQQIVQAPQPEIDTDEARRLRWRNRYLEGRVRYLEEELVKTGGFRTADTRQLMAEGAVTTATIADVQVLEADKPQLLEAPRGGVPDDLKEIAGVGPKLESVLNSLGVYHFDQIAAWTEREVAWVNAAIAFKGRIEREKWIEQSRLLAQGVETDGKRKYREGKHT
jgi:predicted flap endonuclease-1-like 5' DNA nuclease